MGVTIDDVRHVAALARLGVTDERAQALVGELNTILDHVAALTDADTSRLEAVAGVGSAGMPLRDDNGPAIPLSRPVTEFAPSVRDGFLLVPRLSTHETADES